METNQYTVQVKRTFSAIDPKVKLRWDRILNYPRAIEGKLTQLSSEEPRKIASKFLQTHKELLQLKYPERDLKLDKVKIDSAGNSRSYFHQFHNDLPVCGGYMALFTDSDGVVISFEARYHTNIETKMSQNVTEALRQEDSKENVIPAEQAHAIAEKASEGRRQGTPFLIIYPFQNTYYKAYHVEVSGIERENPADWIYFIDAYTGQIINRYNTIDFAGMVDGGGVGINMDETAASPERSFRVFNDDDGNYYLRNTEYSPEIHVYDIAGGGFHNSYAGRDNLAMDADGQWDDYNNPSRVDNQRPETEGYWVLRRIVDYYARDKVVSGIHLFNRNGWDDGGGDWRMIVHYRSDAGVDYKGSFFSRNATHGSRVYHGDGDGTIFTYKAVLDASAHEWAHGVQFSEIAAPAPGMDAGFDGSLSDPFAIKEAIADVLACCIDTEGGGWRMGKEFEEDIVYFSGVYDEDAIGLRLRSIEDPSKYINADGDRVFSDHMEAAADTAGRGYVTPGNSRNKSNGYKNCTILSHAFYLMAMGGTHPTGVVGYDEIQVVGQGVGFVENILYRYLVHRATAQDTLQEFREKIISSCLDLYPGDACKEWCVKRAFDAVGLYDDAIGGVTELPAGVNLNITPWGAKNGINPYWQSPDVYCLGASGTVVEPKKNQVNRLVAIVRNLGSAPANGTTVNFYFSPFGHGYRHEDFKFIGSEVIDVPADGTDTVAEVSWDLTDLTDDFGGVWPRPIDDFDHFCVRVEIAHLDEVYPCDNECQHNFTNVENVPDEDGDGVWNFVIANPYARPVWALIHLQSNLPASMKHTLKLFGDEQIPIDEMSAKPDYVPDMARLVALGPKQKRVAQLRVFIPRKEAMRLAKEPGGRQNLKSISLVETIDDREVGGIEVGFFGKDLWNIPSKKPHVQPVLRRISIEGKVHSLSYNDRGEFIGFTLRLVDGELKYFESITERLEERLNQARLEDRFVAVQTAENAKIISVKIDGR